MTEWSRFWPLVFEDDDIGDWLIVPESADRAIERITAHGRNRALDSPDAEVLLGALAIALLEPGGPFEGKSIPSSKSLRRSEVPADRAKAAIRLIVDSELVELFGYSDDWLGCVRTVAEHHGVLAPRAQTR